MLSIEPTPYNSFRIQASSNEELASAFLRPQEHYESPNDDFRTRPFTLGEYKHWYTKTRGAFTYYSDWTGFNIPSRILSSFLQGLFDPLTEQEQTLVDFFRYSSLDHPFYIIGANDDDVFKHELNHAFYTYSNDYQLSINSLFDSKLEYIKYALEYLLTKGYCRYMLYDELQAYILDNDEEVVSLINDPSTVAQVLSYHQHFEDKYHET